MFNFQIKTEESPQWSNFVIKYDECEYDFLHHVPSGEIYNFDPTHLTRLKCVAITGATPVVSIARSIYWFASSIFMIVAEVYEYLDKGNDSHPNFKPIYEKLCDSARALSYGFLMTITALKGIFYPLQARQQYGEYERTLNRHPDGPHRDKFYLAFCFQRLYVLSKEESDLPKAEDRLNKYLNSIDKLVLKVTCYSLNLKTLPAKTPCIISQLKRSVLE